jgi:hypothetical protein
MHYNKDCIWYIIALIALHIHPVHSSVSNVGVAFCLTSLGALNDASS